MQNTSDAVKLSSVGDYQIVAQDENKSNSEIIADWGQSLKHFQLLGKDPNKSRLRFISPIKDGSLPRKSDATEEEFFKHSVILNSYLVVNTGGDKKADIVSCVALWTEYDHLEKHLQQSAWQDCGLPEPSFQVDTGGQSIHSYWVFSEPITDVKAWEELESDWLAQASSMAGKGYKGIETFTDKKGKIVDPWACDLSVGDPSRVMRLAGGIYYSKVDGGPVAVSRIIRESGKRYSYDELRSHVPEGLGAKLKASLKGKPKPQPKPDKVVEFKKPKPQPKPDTEVSDKKDYETRVREVQESANIDDFNWEGHQWQLDATDPDKARGNCPWHESSTGTAFYVSRESESGHLLFRCPTCDVGGSIFDYRFKRKMKDPHAPTPKGSDFLKILDELCIEKGIVAQDDGLYSPSKLEVMQDLLRYKFREHVKFNEMSQEVEVYGVPIDFDLARAWWCENFGETEPHDLVSQALLSVARENCYHPVQAYLAELPQGDPSILDNLASRFLGNDSSLANCYLKKTLIGAVARIMQPGCKLDTCCILQGRQGIGKSRFWQALARSPQWFDDNFIANSSDKDEKLKIARFWLIELAELESLYRKKDVSSVRSLLSTSVDSIRPPYGRSMKQLERRSIFVGSVNPRDFLADPEGNRRFWVIPTARVSIPSQSEVDVIWAAALAAYRSGETWWLSSDEESMQLESNKDFEQSDPWESIISDLLQSQKSVTIPYLLKEIGIDPALQSRREETRVAQILRRCGFERCTQRIGGKVQRVWSVTDVGSKTDIGYTSVTPSVTVQNQGTVRVSADDKTSVTLVTDNLSKLSCDSNDNPKPHHHTTKTAQCEEEKSNVGEFIGYTVTRSPNPCTERDSGVTDSVTDVRHEERRVTLELGHFESMDGVPDYSEIDWIDVDYWHQSSNPRLLAQTHHLGGVGSRCVYKNKVGTISCLTFDDNGLMKMFMVTWDDGSQLEPHPGECLPYFEDWMLG